MEIRCKRGVQCQFFLCVVDFRGVAPVYFHAVWKVKVPPKIHFFLWLVSHNKLLTRDNLVKRQNVDDTTCVFCTEPESCSHLFFECVVAKSIWVEVKRITGLDSFQVSFSSIASMWICEKNIYVA